MSNGTDLKIAQAVSMIVAMTGTKLTEEQREVVYNFNDSMVVFASPGTGKTTTAVAGLIAAQTVHGIQGRKINAMSFTKMATIEIAVRYKEACTKCGISPNVKFNTFHSICYRIIRDEFPLFSVRSSNDVSADLEAFKAFLLDEGVARSDDMYYVRSVYRAMSSLNSELLFSKAAVMSSSKFIEIQSGITIRQFQIVRARWFKRNIVMQSITEGELPLVVLFILCMTPKIAETLRGEFELMVVDEFQDMSLLYLAILDLISTKLIVIGDIKQQIFGFNGASTLILDAYKKMYPDAVNLELTQSFRCADEIVEKANLIIEPNDIKGYLNFKGTGRKGNVSIVSNSSNIFENVVNQIKTKQDNKEYNDILFLARNNASVMPIVEKLYSKGVMFRATKLQRVMDLPIFRDICRMADVAKNSKNKEYVKLISHFIPEFRWLPEYKNPILEVMGKSSRETDKDFLTMNYSFDKESSYVIMNKLKKFKELDESGVPFITSMVPLLDIFEDYVIEGKWWKIDQEKEYYIKLVESIVSNKDYATMFRDETDKFNKNKYYCDLREGVRCYTFHSSKGLEAQIVYLIDVDNAIVPHDSKLKKLIDSGCSLDASKELRNERNLLYVAVSRCKEDLTIIHNGTLTALIESPMNNKYKFLDEVYREKAVLADETKAFKMLMGLDKL